MGSARRGRGRGKQDCNGGQVRRKGRRLAFRKAYVRFGQRRAMTVFRRQLSGGDANEGRVGQGRGGQGGGRVTPAEGGKRRAEKRRKTSEKQQKRYKDRASFAKQRNRPAEQSKESSKKVQDTINKCCSSVRDRLAAKPEQAPAATIKQQRAAATTTDCSTIANNENKNHNSRVR